MAYHRIKLRRDEQTTAVTCPYAISGVCYRRGCIFIPHQHCLSKSEFDKRLKIAMNKQSSKKQKFVKRAKIDKEHYPINKIKIMNSTAYGIIIHERGFGKKHER